MKECFAVTAMAGWEEPQCYRCRVVRLAQNPECVANSVGMEQSTPVNELLENDISMEESAFWI